MAIFGSICILYWLILCIYTKKPNTTFAPFLLFAGVILIAYERVGSYLPAWCVSIVMTLALIGFVLFLTVESLILIFARQKAPEDLEYLIVLGAQIRGKKITNTLQRRLDAALAYTKKNVHTKIIVSGGQGKHEDISEAEAMRRYLMERGFPKIRLCVEDKSTTTYENLRNSAQFLKKERSSVGIVTNNFHIFRSIWIAKHVGYKNVSGVTAGTKKVMWPNYMVREFFAVCKELICEKRRKKDGKQSR